MHMIYAGAQSERKESQGNWDVTNVVAKLGENLGCNLERALNKKRAKNEKFDCRGVLR